MSFAARITTHPLPHDPDLGAETLRALPELPPELRPLLEGAAGSSPYLARLIAAHGEALPEMLAGEPEAVMAGLVAQTEAEDGPGLGKRLRGLKRKAALLIALADLGGVWDVATVTGALTDLAEAATRSALRAALMEQAKRGRLPGISEEMAAEGAGMVVLAMGKMGAHELNYSSDIDLICLFDDERFDPGDVLEARSGFIKATRAMAQSLSAVTPEGYVFRTDLRLRPDPSSTPVCVAMRAAAQYYEAEGRSWERAAYIKARPVAGSLEAGARFLDGLTPFIWRKHLDFNAIHETQSIQQRIRDHRGLYADGLDGRNVKLGAGGIREIEFFVQTQQLVSGGRDPSLRLRGTLQALAALTGAGWVPEDTAAHLGTAYGALRSLEHRLQMINDAQTHSLPQTAEGFDRLARLSGQADTVAYCAELEALFAGVRRQTEGFFTREDRAAPEPEMSDTTQSIVDRWPGYPALRSERGREIFARLRPGILTGLMAAAKPEEAVSNFDGFLSGLPAGVQLFSLFEANPELVELIVDISATAPGLSRYLSRHAQVLDAVLDGGFFAPWPGAEALTGELSARLEGADFETALDQARRWQKEWHFRIGVHFLRRLIDAGAAGAQYSDLAEATVRALWPCVLEEIARRHGPAPGKGACVVAMGSLGTQNVAAGSDLDLMVLYDADGVEASDGPRPLDTRTWYARATKTLVSALSAPTAEGTLYAVDMRLRPSGRQGPVATSVAGFDLYQREEAWTWEHLALTRARVVAGPEPLAARIEAIRRGVLAMPRDRDAVLKDTAQMRARLQAAGRSGGDLDVKSGPGGAQDIALLAQAGTLIAGETARGVEAQLTAAQGAGLIGPEERAGLLLYAGLFEGIRQGVMLLADRPGAEPVLGDGGRAFLARSAGASDWAALVSQSALARKAATAIIAAVLPASEANET